MVSELLPTTQLPKCLKFQSKKTYDPLNVREDLFIEDILRNLAINSILETSVNQIVNNSVRKIKLILPRNVW